MSAATTRAGRLAVSALCLALATRAGAQVRPDAGASATRDAGAPVPTPAAQPLAVDAALARLEAARAQVRTLEAEFDQERAMGLFAQVVRARGRLVVQRPDRVRWEVTAPERGVFIVAGGRVAYRAGSSAASASQAQVGPLGAVLGDLAAFLGGALAPLRQRYQLSAASRADGAIVLTAVPREPAVARVVNRVVLAFRADGRAVEQIEMEEPGGDRTRIALRGVQINSGRVTPAAFTP